VSYTIGKDRHEKVGEKDLLDVGKEIHLKAGLKVVIESGATLTLKGQGGFIEIGPEGITIKGLLVKVNCTGGSPTDGTAAEPKPPDDARPAQPIQPQPADREYPRVRAHCACNRSGVCHAHARPGQSWTGHCPPRDRGGRGHGTRQPATHSTKGFSSAWPTQGFPALNQAHFRQTIWRHPAYHLLSRAPEQRPLKTTRLSVFSC